MAQQFVDELLNKGIRLEGPISNPIYVINDFYDNSDVLTITTDIKYANNNSDTVYMYPNICHLQEKLGEWCESTSSVVYEFYDFCILSGSILAGGVHCYLSGVNKLEIRICDPINLKLLKFPNVKSVTYTNLTHVEYDVIVYRWQYDIFNWMYNVATINTIKISCKYDIVKKEYNKRFCCAILCFLNNVSDSNIIKIIFNYYCPTIILIN